MTARQAGWEVAGLVLLAIAVLAALWVLQERWVNPHRPARAIVMLTLPPERSLGAMLVPGCRVDVWSASGGVRIGDGLTVVDVRPAAADGKRFVYLDTASDRAAPLVQIADAALTLHERCPKP